MARDLNKVMLIGRLAADPELRAVPSGQSLVQFRVATNRQWNDAQGQQQSQVEFTSVVAWGKLADLAHQYLRKGRQVYVEGRLQTRSWTDRQNVKHWRTEVVAENLIFLGAPSVASADLPADAGVRAGAPVKADGVGNVPPPPAPGAGAPKAPATVAAGVPGEQIEEIRIEDIPF